MRNSRKFIILHCLFSESHVLQKELARYVRSCSKISIREKTQRSKCQKSPMLQCVSITSNDFGIQNLAILTILHMIAKQFAGVNTQKCTCIPHRRHTLQGGYAFCCTSNCLQMVENNQLLLIGFMYYSMQNSISIK